MTDPLEVKITPMPVDRTQVWSVRCPECGHQGCKISSKIRRENLIAYLGTTITYSCVKCLHVFSLSV